MMRSKFDEQLEVLNQELIRMGMMCENAIRKSACSLLEHDLLTAATLPDLVEQINQKDREIENFCLRLLLQQQPVARDLRAVSSALKMVTDMDRIGVQSADIAEIVTMDSVKEVDESLPVREMATSVIRMVSESIDAFVKKDVEAARAVIEFDNVVDGYFDSVKKQLIISLKQPGENGEMILDLLMISKYLERIGDQAVNIASWVIFSITGQREGVQGK